MEESLQTSALSEMRFFARGVGSVWVSIVWGIDSGERGVKLLVIVSRLSTSLGQ